MPEDLRTPATQTPPDLGADPDPIRAGDLGPDPAEVVVIPEAPGSGSPSEVLAPSGTPTSPHVVNPARRRALMPWAVVAGVLVVLGAGGVGLTYSPVFHAKTITVSGERRLSEAKILKIAGIGPATDVFHVDLGALEQRLEKDPWIARAVVSRHLPSSLSVVITERRPVALTRSADGTLVYLALDGTVLAPAPGSPILPQVQVAADASTDPSALATGAAVAQALPPALLPAVASISVDAAGSVVVGMRSGVTATYGDGSDLAAKGQALKAVLDYATQHGGVLASVDVEVPGAPTAVFSSGVTASP